MKKPAAKAVAARTRDPDATRLRILAAAKSEFAKKGLGGARVDDIAAKARINKRMLYHYFGNKEELFKRTLEDAYGAFRSAEAALKIEQDDPVTALRRLMTFTWEYYLANPEFITLVNSENLHKARHIRKSDMMDAMNRPFVARMQTLLERGVAEGVFRAGPRPRAGSDRAVRPRISLSQQPSHRRHRLWPRPDVGRGQGGAPHIQHRRGAADRVQAGDPDETGETGMSGTALVTGARRGIGKAIALALADAGFDVAVCDVALSDDLAGVAREIAGKGRASAAIAGDIANIEDHARMLDEAAAALGPLTTLVNNAGVSVMVRGDLLDVSPESYDRCLDINTRGTFFLTQEFARRLLDVKSEAHRSIVTVSSANAVAPSIARGEYCVSKAGVSMISKLFAARLSNDGIGVYEIQPGFIETDMTAPSKPRYDSLIENGLTVIKRWGKPEEVARIAVTLASGLLPYTSGQIIQADAGLLTVRY